MGIFFGLALFVSLFSGLYLMYGAEQMERFQEPKTTAAQIMRLCHDAGVAEARTLGAAFGNPAVVQRNCIFDATATTGLSNGMATGLQATNVVIGFYPGTRVGLTAGDRAIVTHLAVGNTLSGIRFQEVQDQLGRLMYGEPTAGMVTTNGASNFIESVPGIQVLVPSGGGNGVAEGELAMVTTITP